MCIFCVQPQRSAAYDLFISPAQSNNDQRSYARHVLSLRSSGAGWRCCFDVAVLEAAGARLIRLSAAKKIKTHEIKLAECRTMRTDVYILAWSHANIFQERVAGEQTAYCKLIRRINSCSIVQGFYFSQEENGDKNNNN